MVYPLRQLSAVPADGAVDAPARPVGDSYRRLADVFHQILSEQELDTLLEQVAETLADLVPYDTLSIYEADETARELVPVYARDRWRAEILGSRNRFGEGITGWAVQEQRPVLTNEAHRDPRRKTVPGTPADEAEALVCIPLIARGAVKGALNVYRLGEEAFFTPDEFELAQRFGDAVALAFDNAQTRARLQLQAQTDSLTGLFNHRYFHERLRAELGRTNRSHEPLSVAMVDIDEFKRVNDVHGHGTGDEVLLVLADMLRAELRVSDVVCRIGGEEFAVIMPGCTAEAAVDALARLHERLASEPVGTAGSIGLSIGISSAPQHGMNPRELLTCAEAAMMTAKTRGGASSLVFSESDVERPAGDDVRERDLRSIAHLKMLQRLGGKLNRLNELKEIGAAVTDELRKLIDYHNCRVYVLEGEDLRPIGFRGDGCEDCRRGLESLSCKVGQGVTGTAAKEGRTLLVGNARDCEFAQVVPGTDPVDETLLAVPLRYGTRVIGVIVVSKLGIDQFPEDDVRMLEVLGGHASVAIENARLYDRAKAEARKANEQLEVANALLVFSQELATAAELDEVLRLVVGLTVELLEAPRGSVWLQDEPDGDLRPAALHGYRPDDARRLRAVRIGADSAERLLGGGEPVVASAAELAALDGAPDTLTSASFRIAPFRLDDRWGCLVVNTPEGQESLDEQKLRLLEGLSHQARLAIANASSFARLRRTLFSAVEALANAAEANDRQTSSHSREITDVAVEVGREMGLDPARLRNLEYGALFHDIGKIAVPTSILRKPGPLTSSERSVVETHPEWGERILSPIEDFAAIRPIVRHCHERFDGTGYPDGKAGEEIPIESRIVFVCDAFHAMTTDRPYRKALPHEEAERRLREAAGTQFDPAVVDAFLRLRRRG
jgi:diguanylate cyclase (GGDEF)-like protein